MTFRYAQSVLIALVMVVLSAPGCTRYQLKLETFHLAGAVKAADSGKPIEGARVRVIETSFIDSKRYKDLNEDIGQSGKDGRIDLNYKCKACRVAGPFRRMGDALGRKEPPGKLGIEIFVEGYDPLQFLTPVDDLPRNEQGRCIVEIGEVSLKLTSTETAKKSADEKQHNNK